MKGSPIDPDAATGSGPDQRMAVCFVTGFGTDADSTAKHDCGGRVL